MLSLKLGHFLAIENSNCNRQKKIKGKMFSLRSTILNTILISCHINEKNSVTI